MKLADRWQR